MTIKQLEVKANEIRQDIIKMLVEAGSGHSAGSLGMADVFTAMYFGVLHHKPKDPGWEHRDRLVLSNGHICPVLYATMAHAGYFPKSELKTLRKLGTRLQGHPHRGALPGIETTSGPLGSGLSQAAGMALAAQMDKARWQVYCMISDGEQDAGNNWEAVMIAGKNRLSKLTAIMDRNNIQIDGKTEDIMPLEPLKKKYQAFNWNVIDIDGHNIQMIINATNQARSTQHQPTLIIAHTTPGKGVDFMEDDYRWHGSPPGKVETERAPKKSLQAKVALQELRTLQGKIKSEHQ